MSPPLLLWFYVNAREVEGAPSTGWALGALALRGVEALEAGAPRRALEPPAPSRRFLCVAASAELAARIDAQGGPRVCVLAGLDAEGAR